MCGVAGIFAYHYAANCVNREELRRIRDHMQARGPDGSGEWVSPDERVGLGHRRLAIIDLSPAGHQPMLSADGQLAISFNGEIYNYKVLRAELEREGCVFRSDSDTEVLLQMYAMRGESMLSALRGMFAFAIWDARKNAMFLARDPYGIKPLYYTDDGWTCRVASQVKALLSSARVSKDPDPAGQVGFYLWGSVPEPFTLYQQIRAVPAGSYLWVDALGAAEPKSYFSIASIFHECQPSPVAPEEAQRIVREALLDSVKHHLVSDVPVGAFLSAGIDSGTLVGLMRDAGQKRITTVTLAFDEFTGRLDDEALLAEQTASRYSTQHTTRRVGQTEFDADLPKIMEAMDQPSIDGLNTWFVAKAACEQGLKVAISGLGGDELFGGYPSFKDVPRWIGLLSVPSRVPGAGYVFRKCVNAFSPKRASPKLAGMLRYGGNYPGAYFLRRGLFMPWELPTLFDEALVTEGLHRLGLISRIDGTLQPDPGTPFTRVASLESGLYMRNQLLRDTDWASMAHSLEVRAPLVDSGLLRALAPLMASNAVKDKQSLAQSPSVSLPDAVLGRRKTGFTTPIPAWLQDNPLLGGWRDRPLLLRAECPWARRWAYTVLPLATGAT